MVVINSLYPQVSTTAIHHVGVRRGIRRPSEHHALIQPDHYGYYISFDR